MLNLREYRSRTDRLADHLPWAALVAPGVVLNKDGSFQRTLRFRGPDLESATEAELVSACARANNVLKRFGSGWALHIEAERREAPGYPASDFPDAASWLVDEERRASFEAAGAHFESRYHLTLGSLTMGFETSAHAQITVFDPTNYSQTVLTAARMLQQVNNQIQSLQNEAQMLLRLDRNLKGIAFPQLQALLDKLDGIDRLMQQAQSVDFEVDQLEARLKALYPRSFDPASTRDQRLQAARARYDASTDALRRTMTVQSGIVQQAREDAEPLADLIPAMLAAFLESDKAFARSRRPSAGNTGGGR